MKIEQVVSDGAQGLKKGIAEAELGIEHQLDLFHTLREALRVSNGLEREAYKAIRKEAEREKVVYSAKSEKVFSKRYEQWVQTAKAMEKQIEVYELYSWLVKELREGLEFVSAESGILRSVYEMETQIMAVASLMREMPHTKVQAVAERLERQKGELVKYLDPLQEKLAELIAQVGDEELVRLCMKEWRLEKETRPNHKTLRRWCPQEGRAHGNLKTAVASVERGGGQTGPEDSALAIGTSGAGIKFGRDS